MSRGFVHLHNHTDFSMLDGAARVDDLVKAAKAQGMPALGITDHGNMFGAYEFYKAAQREGVKPIIGLEAYLTPAPRWSASGSSSATVPATTSLPRVPTPT